MQLADVVADLPWYQRFGDAHVMDCTDDSRQVRPGWLFAAVPGTRADGHDYAAAAVRAGATALLVQRRLPLPVPQVVVPSVVAALGPVAAAVHGHPSAPLTLAGITGTNGKTTTAYLLHAALAAAGWPSGLVSTVQIAVRDAGQPADFTTPPAPDLQRVLARMRAQEVSAAVLEVSSHALDQHRVAGITFDVGVFTTLQPEHLDYHGTLEHYYASKASLFAPERCRHAVVCVDGEWGRRLAAQAAVPVTTFGRHAAADVTVRLVAADLGRMCLRLDGAGETVELNAPLIGRHHATNLAAAYLAARSLGVPSHAARAGLADPVHVPGRFERIRCGQPFEVVVDFAHTPDALDALIATGREVAPRGRVILVFGAPGHRDRFNRPELGRVACAADLAILTTDDFGDEDPDRIFAEIRLGMLGARNTRVLLEHDRGAAIHAAIADARAGDIVLIAGRGHLTSQHIGHRLVPFDDRAVARDALAHAGWSDFGEMATASAARPQEVRR